MSFLHRKSRRLSTADRASQRRFRRPWLEPLEERVMLDAAGALVVGRTLSAYAVGDVVDNRLTIDYSVYNQEAKAVSGVLLTTTLQPGVSFVGASVLPDRNGQQLAWSLGPIEAFGRATVRLTVGLPPGGALQLDAGARAFGTLDAGLVSDQTPAAVLRPTTVAPDLLAATQDANTADPFVQEQAAKLDYDPQRIFDYLNNEVAYESYAGSLRGSRGTLWSAAGNSLDEASLGVALFRASGIPARYAHGTLSDALSKQLILSMFPASFQTVGYVPSGTAVSDPANDTQLLAETRDHYWVQVDLGGGFVDADTSGLGGTAIGTAYATPDSTLTQIADGLRQKARVVLTAEHFSQAAAAFGLGDGIGSEVVLDQTFRTVELVGKAVTLGHLLSTSSVGGPVISSQTITYTPYLSLLDEADPDPAADHTILGHQYQDVYTNFPLGTQVSTALFLDVTLTGPGMAAETHSRALADRIGFDVRQNGGSPRGTFAPDGPPLVTPFQVWTLAVSASREHVSRPGAILDAQQPVGDALARAVADRNDSQVEASLTRLLMARTRAEASGLLVLTQGLTAPLAAQSRVRAYADRPRLLVTAAELRGEGDAGVTLAAGIDLLRDTVRVVGYPGQSEEGLATFRYARGLLENAIEDELSAPAAAPPAGAAMLTRLSVFAVMRAAQQQGVAVVTLAPDDVARLDGLALSAEAKARIAVALQDGLAVSVPVRMVTIGERPAVAWWQTDLRTGETTGVGEDGTHQAFVAYAAVATAFAVGTAAASFAYLDGALAAEFIINGADVRRIFRSNRTNDFEDSPGRSLRGGPGLLKAALIADLEQELEAKLARTRIVLRNEFEAGARTILNSYIRQLGDPPLPEFLVAGSAGPRPSPLARTNRAAPASAVAGAVGGATSASSLSLTGGLQASWTTDATNTFPVASLSAQATVRDSAGAVVGSGAVALAAAAPVTAAVSGTNCYRVSGTGALAVYGPAASTLGVSAEWDSYTATVTGALSINLATAGLTLNGVALPAGTYLLETVSASLSGSGPSAAPDFSGSVAITAVAATVSVGPAGPGVSAGGSPLDLVSGGTFTDFTGTIDVAAGAGAEDDLTLTGTAAHVLTVAASAAAVTADQNTPVIFQASVRTSLAGEYELTALAPDGWGVTIDGGNVTVTPAPGTQGGTFPVLLIARSTTNPDLVAQATVHVTVAPTAAGLALAVTPDTLYTVPAPGGAQSPTAFQATVRNLGPAADTYTLSVPNLPAGFGLLSSGTSVTVPAGQTGILGVYLRPDGPNLPAPGTPVSFTVNATSTTDPSITRTQTVTFATPDVHGLTFTATPAGAGTTPGSPVPATLTLTAVGNVPETVALTADLSAGLGATGLPPTVTLNPGESVTIPFTLAPAADVPLNSTLNVTITAAFNPLGEAFDLSVQVPVRVVASGADALASAAAAADQLGSPDLSDRLENLAIALTRLVQTPTDPVPRAQAVAALAAIAGLLGADPFLSGAVAGLAAPRDALLAATTPAEIQGAMAALADALAGLDDTLTDVARHGFTLQFAPNTATALPGAAAVYTIGLTNNGSQPTTYDLTVTGLPPGVTAVFDEPAVTLQPGESRFGGADPITLSLTQATASLLPVGFTVTATARPAPGITRSFPGTLTVRADSVTVASVTAAPAFTDPGGSVAVSARVLGAVNQPRQVQASFQVKAPTGTVVFTSPSVSVTLAPQTSLLVVDLGVFGTTGLPPGDYSIDVTLAETDGTPITGATGRGRVQVGLPVGGRLTVGGQSGLRAAYYDFTTALVSIPPDFVLNNRSPDVTRIDASINFPNGNGAFAGLDGRFADTFSVRYRGFIRIDTPGAYTFFLSSDDGSRLTVGGGLPLVDNNGIHGFQERSGTVTLAAGFHALALDYFENDGAAGLVLEWAGPGFPRQVVPASVLSVEAVPLDVSATVPAGDVTVTTQLTVTGRTSLPSPLTLTGQAATTPSSSTLALRGGFAYVAGSEAIDVFDVSDPADPVLVSSFGSDLIVQGGYATVRPLGADKIIVGTSTGLNANAFTLLIYSVADPAAPVLLSSEAFPHRFLGELLVSGDLVLAPTSGGLFNFFGQIDQFGDVIAIDVSDPTDPFETDRLFGTRNQPDDGDTGQGGAVFVTPTLAYVASTTSVGADPRVGQGRLLVVDASDPAELAFTQLLIPNTVRLGSVALEGDRALVVGDTGQGRNFTLTVLDTSDPANPVILGATLVTGADLAGTPFNSAANVKPLGNGLFAVSNTAVNGQPALLLVNPSDADNVAVLTIPVSERVSEAQVAGGLLYAVGATGLTVYTIGQIQTVPFTASVRVPKGTGVGVVPGSFTVPPSQIIPGPDFDTLLFERTFAFGQNEFTFAYQTAVTDLRPGESRAVTLGAAVDFTSGGTPGSFDLPGTVVAARQSAGVGVTLAPASQTVRPGSAASFTVTVTNPSDQPAAYTLSVLGVPEGWVSLPPSVAVAAQGSASVTLVLTPEGFAAPQEYGFAVVAQTAAAAGAAQGTLTVAGPAPVADAQAHGVVATLTPAQATAGQGTSASFVVRVTNTGSATETFDLTAVLPAGVTGIFTRDGRAITSLAVPPGASNFREVTLTLTAAVGVAPAEYPFAVSATSRSSSAASTVTATLNVVAAGVAVTLDRTSGAPGDTFTATVTNTGTVADTFDLSVAGPGAVVATLATPRVTLGPGQSRAVTVTTGAADFAVRGDLPFAVTARSTFDVGVIAAAAAVLQVPATTGLASNFDPAVQVIPLPGGTDFLLIVQNTGNSEMAYSATVSGTTGPLSGMLVGLDGQPTRTIPVFRLPGLSTGALLLRAVLSDSGEGTAVVSVASLDGTLASSATATLRSPAVMEPPVVERPPTSPLPSPYVGTVAVGAATSGGLVTLPDGPAALTTAPFAGFAGEVRVARGDVNGDGVPDLIFGAGPGAPGGHVKVFDGATGAEARSFMAFDGFSGGVYVAAADVNGDGRADLVVGAGAGPAGGHVKVFDGRTGSALSSFLAFEGFTGGARVAGGDVDGDVFADVIVGAGPGHSGGHVKAFSGADGSLLRSFLAFDGFIGGVFVGTADLDGDGCDEIVAGADAGAMPHVKAFSAADEALMSFLAYLPPFRGGVRVGRADVNGDGRDEIVTGDGPGQRGHVTAAGLDGLLASLFVTGDEASRGIYVG